MTNEVLTEHDLLQQLAVNARYTAINTTIIKNIVLGCLILSLTAALIAGIIWVGWLRPMSESSSSYQFDPSQPSPRVEFDPATE